MKQFDHLSKGCQLCQQGKWLCIFLTYRCNAACHFCPAPFRDDRVQSAFGSTKEEILPYLLKNDFKGISFSGGDPFIVFERLLEWFIYFKMVLPDNYFWVYTSGINASQKKLEKLAAAGMDEIRFNIAASGYVSEKIWHYIRLAKKYFPKVAIEIPSISKDKPLLINALELMESENIDYLNLHDYIINPSDLIGQEETTSPFVLNKISKLNYSLASIKNTTEILRLAKSQNYHFQINHCSMQQKERQMTLRRIHFGKLFNNPQFDDVMDDGTICNYFSIPKKLYQELINEKPFPGNQYEFIKPYLTSKNKIDKLRSTGLKIMVARYIPKMESNQKRILLELKEFLNP